MIDLCVVSYCTKDKLKRLVDTLMSDVDSINPVWNLYIQDNGSDDGSAEYLEGLDPYEHALQAVLSTNVGYSAACNHLATLGESDVIGLLNADVWMTTHDVYAIDKIFQENPEISILGPKQRDETGRITHAGIFGSNVRPKHRGWKLLDPYDELYRDRVEAVTVSGSAYFVRRGVWEELSRDSEYRALYPEALGPFLPTPHYYEETFCSYFARHRGHKVFYDGTVSIGHSWHASSEVGGPMEKLFPVSQGMFRSACDSLGIAHD